MAATKTTKTLIRAAGEKDTFALLLRQSDELLAALELSFALRRPLAKSGWDPEETCEVGLGRLLGDQQSLQLKLQVLLEVQGDLAHQALEERFEGEHAGNGDEHHAGNHCLRRYLRRQLREVAQGEGAREVAAELWQQQL